MAVIDRGIEHSPVAVVERPLYPMTGLRQGELLGLRWIDLDMRALKVRVRQAYVRGEFKSARVVRPCAFKLSVRSSVAPGYVRSGDSDARRGD
jgi:integrase